MTEQPSSFAAYQKELERLRAETASLRLQLTQTVDQAREDSQRHQRAAEQLQHRARNTMALVRSAFKQTLDTGGSLEDVEMHFCGRLAVLSRYMLPRAGWPNPTIDLESIIRDELQSFEFGDAPGITLAGPDAALSLEQAQSFALAIHELVTNALKFGALSGPQNAYLSVTWKIEDDELGLVWQETGVPIVALAPVHRGFGREFIEDALPYQIGAATRFDCKAGGVRCAINLGLMPHVHERFMN